MKKISWDDLHRSGVLRSYSGRLFVYRPSKYLVTLLLREMRDPMRGLRAATETLRKGGCGIEGLYLSAEEGGFSDAALVASCERGGEDAIAEKIRELGICGDVVLIETPDPSLGGNPFFPLTIFDARAVVFRESVYGGIFRGARARFGEEAAKAFLYHVGLEVGREAAESLPPI